MDFEQDKEKIINKLPSPYSFEITPYNQADFKAEIKEKCFNEHKRTQLSAGWLKIGKVIIIGDVSVGKTCLVNRYCKKFFDTNYKSTIGVDFEVEKYLILGVPFILQIWDTAGQERFKSIAQSYYRGASVLIVVFDLTNYESLLNTKKWFNEGLNANLEENPFLFLIGTKRDLMSNYNYKQIKSQAFEIAKEINAEYWSASSKTGKNVDKLFSRVAALSFEQLLLNEDEAKPFSINIGNKLMANEVNKKKLSTVKCCN